MRVLGPNMSCPKVGCCIGEGAMLASGMTDAVRVGVQVGAQVGVQVRLIYESKFECKEMRGAEPERK